MKVRQAVEQLNEIAAGLRFTYPHAFEKVPRAAWEIRMAAGGRQLEEAILKLKSTIAETEAR